MSADPHTATRENWAQTLRDRLRRTCRKALVTEMKRWPTDAEIDARVAEIEGRHEERSERLAQDGRGPRCLPD